MVLACGKERREIAMWVNGSLARQMGMEFMFGSMEIVTRANFLNVSSTGRELSVIQVEISIKDSSSKENQMAMGNIIGKMEVTSKASLKWEDEKDKAYGRNHQEIAISMKDSIFKTRRMDMEYFHGTMATFIKDPTRMMKGTVMDKCIGWMAAITRASGKLACKKDKVKLIIFRYYLYPIRRHKERNIQRKCINLDLHGRRSSPLLSSNAQKEEKREEYSFFQLK